jgi:hypothetical protein
MQITAASQGKRLDGSASYHSTASKRQRRRCGSHCFVSSFPSSDRRQSHRLNQSATSSVWVVVRECRRELFGFSRERSIRHQNCFCTAKSSHGKAPRSLSRWASYVTTLPLTSVAQLPIRCHLATNNTMGIDDGWSLSLHRSFIIVLLPSALPVVHSVLDNSSRPAISPLINKRVRE